MYFYSLFALVYLSPLSIVCVLLSSVCCAACLCEINYILGILSGRPFGGTAVLLRKRLAERTFQLIITDYYRLTAVRCSMPVNVDVIFCSVYMQFKDISVDYWVEFEAVVGVMQGLTNKCLGSKFVFWWRL